MYIHIYIYIYIYVIMAYNYVINLVYALYAQGTVYGLRNSLV